MFKKTDEENKDLNNPASNGAPEDEGFDNAFDEFSDSDEPEDEDNATLSDDDEGVKRPSSAGGDEKTGNKSVKNDDVDDYAPPTKEEWQRAQQEISSNRGRISAFQRQLNENAAQQANSRLKEVNKEEGKKASSLDSDDWKSLKEDYPEIAGPVEAAIQSMAQKLDDANAKVSVLEGNTEVQQIQKNITILEETHPDWVAVAQDPKFIEFVNNQPEPVRKVFAENSEDIKKPNEVSWLLSLFKREAGYETNQDEGDTAPKSNPLNKLQVRRANQMKSAGNPTAKSGKAPPKSAPDDFDDAFDYYSSRK